MDDISLRLKLLSGQPIEIDKALGSLKPLTLKEIIEHGYSEYFVKLNIILMEVSDLLDSESEEYTKFIEAGVTAFDIMVKMGGEEMAQEFEKALTLFFGTDVKVDSELHVVTIGFGHNTKMIHRENFDKVREVIKWQNGINKFGEDNSPKAEDSEAVKRIKEKIQKGKESLAKVKSEEENDFDISDIISAVSTKSNSINKLNVFDLTIYQLYDEFRRLETVDQYQIGIQSMLAGAKDVKLKHWSSKLD